MILKLFTRGLAAMLLTLLITQGCKFPSKKAPGMIDGEEVREISARIETIKQVYHLCPSPAEMLSVINFEEMNFEEGLLNQVENRDKYLDAKSQTLALGVYATDMAYAALFGRHRETLDYMEAVRFMAEEIRLTGAISEELLQQARDNVENLDSLFDISNEAFINMLFFCERTERSNTIVLITAGAFIESLFLAVNMMEEYESADYLLQHIAEQKYALDNLIVFAESLKDTDENIEEVLRELSPLKKIYDSIEPGGGELTIKEEGGEGQAKKLVIGGGSSKTPALSQDKFLELRQELLRIRTFITEG